jgi:nitrile hydratase subunit beta
MAFEIGERVRTRAQAAGGHTRLPAYLQRTSGIVVELLGEFPLADERALGRRDARTERLYTVRFAARDVWPDAPAGDTIAADLFESYLEGAR